jgi:hypothetical protein
MLQSHCILPLALTVQVFFSQRVGAATLPWSGQRGGSTGAIENTAFGIDIPLGNLSNTNRLQKACRHSQSANF